MICRLSIQNISLVNITKLQSKIVLALISGQRDKKKQNFLLSPIELQIKKKFKHTHLQEIDFIVRMLKFFVYTSKKVVKLCYWPQQKKQSQIIIEKMRSHIERANNKVRELSESNRLRSNSIIRAEETCFRVKLKMLALLRRINFKTQQIQQLQLLDPQQVIHPLTNKLANFFKQQQKQQKSLTQKSNALCLTLKLKNQQILALKKQLNEKQKEIKLNQSKYKEELKHVNTCFLEKLKETDGLKLEIAFISAKYEGITERLKIKQSEEIETKNKLNEAIEECRKQAEAMKSLSISVKEKELSNLNLINKFCELKNEQKRLTSSLDCSVICSFSESVEHNKQHLQSSQTQTEHHWLGGCENPEIQIERSIEEEAESISDTSSLMISENNESVLRVAEIISQWKNRMYDTVNYYELKMEEYRKNDLLKEELINYLRSLLKY